MSAKDSVCLRQRRLANGNSSLYIDVYRNGKRDYEFLILYLVPEKNKQDKQKIKKPLRLPRLSGRSILWK